MKFFISLLLSAFFSNAIASSCLSLTEFNDGQSTRCNDSVKEYLYTHAMNHIWDEGTENLSPTELEWIKQDQKDAFELMRQIAERGYVDAQAQLGYMYFAGQGTEVNQKEGVKWTISAAEKGDETAQHNLAGMYKLGQGVEANPSKAVYWYKKAAEKGLSDSQYYLADSYCNGWGVEKDLDKCREWAEKAKANGEDVSALLE